MHQQFLICASNEFVPSSGTLEANGIDLRVKTGKGATFPTPIGLGNGLLLDGRGIDAILSASGVDSMNRLSTFVELGPCTPER